LNYKLNTFCEAPQANFHWIE